MRFQKWEKPVDPKAGDVAAHNGVSWFIQSAEQEDIAHKLAMVKADLANANAEIVCLKYENDQLKKELELVTKTMEYMQDERTALLKIIGDKDV